MKVFFDTEFSNLANHPRKSELVSIGFKSEDGSGLYVEVPYNIDMASDFVKSVVVPLLKPNEFLKSKSDAESSICEFLSNFNDRVELICDAPTYDWFYIRGLISKFPENVFLSSVDFKHIKQGEEYLRKYEELVSSGNYRIHHALDDAIIICESYLTSEKLFNRECDPSNPFLLLSTYSDNSCF